jgi:hypothetical protein
VNVGQNSNLHDGLLLLGWSIARWWLCGYWIVSWSWQQDRFPLAWEIQPQAFQTSIRQEWQARKLAYRPQVFLLLALQVLVLLALVRLVSRAKLDSLPERLLLVLQRHPIDLASIERGHDQGSCRHPLPSEQLPHF